MGEAPYPETVGYVAESGFVKSNPLNNDYYVEQWKNDPWYPAIKACHEELTAALPGYNIAQIKGKFGGLRYYIDVPRDEDTMMPVPENAYELAAPIIARAERWVAEFENGRVR